MTVDAESPKISDKEFNFRQLEAKYEKIVSQERAEKERLARELEEARQAKALEIDEGSEPYVDEKRLKKTLDRFGQSTQSEIQKAMEQAKLKAKEELKQEMWLDSNPDFYDVMQNHAQKFMEKAPHLAETILKMPDGFERKKLVYQNIKALGIDRPEIKPQSIQEKIDANRKSPYYQPSGASPPPYSQVADYSPAGQKNAYEQLQKLKANLRLG